MSVVAVGAAAALALAACGTNNNSTSTGSSSAAGTASITCSSGSIKASGSTAQKNAISTWINNYQSKCSGATINYSASGSGAGIQDFINNQVAFAGSDSALNATTEQPKANARCGSGNMAWNLPMVVGPIGVTYNLTGVTKLVLSPSVLAQIFSGKITKWNDPAITALNSGQTLPSTTITTYHRSDSSGTTDNFTKYLTAAAPADWTYGHSKSWAAPGGLGAKGSDQVAASIKSTPNSIGYVEYSFIQNDNLSSAELDNGGGAVTLSPASASLAAAQATIVGTNGDLTLQLNYATKTPGAWPIILVTYEIVCNKGNGSSVDLVKNFLTYTASTDGQALLNGVGSAPIPPSILTKVQASVSQLAA